VCSPKRSNYCNDLGVPLFVGVERVRSGRVATPGDGKGIDDADRNSAVFEFLKSARTRGLTAVDGLGMLLHWPRLLDRCEYQPHDPSRSMSRRSCGPGATPSDIRARRDMGKHLGMFKELHEHSGRGGGPIKLESRPMSDIEAARRVAFALRRALERQKAEKQ
jgi:hypothetical protein